jgi:hypothetical protein
MAYDASYFEGLRRQALSNYTIRAAQNAYQRYLAQTRGERPILEMKEAAFGARKEVPRLTASYGKRGLTGKGVKSGVFNKALSDYSTARTRQLGYAQQDLTQALRGYDLSAEDLFKQYEDTQKDIKEAETRSIAADANELLNLK